MLIVALFLLEVVLVYLIISNFLPSSCHYVVRSCDRDHTPGHSTAWCQERCGDVQERKSACELEEHTWFAVLHIVLLLWIKWYIWAEADK